MSHARDRVRRVSFCTFIFMIVTALAIALQTDTAEASKLRVEQDGSGDHTTIEAALGWDGTMWYEPQVDSIVVGPGTYVPTVRLWLTTSLAVVSTHGLEQTTVDGSMIPDPHPDVFVVSYTDGGVARIDGFRVVGVKQRGSAFEANVSNLPSTAEITNCRVEATLGKHILIGGMATARVTDCVFVDTSVPMLFGNAYAPVEVWSSMTMERCVFVQNTGLYAGAIWSNGEIIVSDCLFYLNSARSGPSAILSEGTGSISRCTFDYNSAASSGQAAVVLTGGGTTFTRNIVSSTLRGPGLSTDGMHSCNVFWNNEGGSLSSGSLAPDEVEADPRFCNRRDTQFTLADGSPALAANSACGELIGAYNSGCPSPAEAPQVISVRQDGSGDFLTIKDAIAWAAPGDMVLVGPGTYAESLQIRRPITLKSSDGPASSILDGQNVRRLIDVDAPFEVVIDGISLVHGSAGAIQTRQSVALTLRNCRVADNARSVISTLTYDETAVHVTVQECVIEDNLEPMFFSSEFATVIVTGCLFRNNTGDHMIHVNGPGPCTISNNTFVGNTADDATIHTTRNTSLWPPLPWDLHINRNIFASDRGGGYAIWIQYENPEHACNLYWDINATHVIGEPMEPTEFEANPMFCNPATGDYRIDQSSPAAPALSPCASLIGAYQTGCTEVPTLVQGFRAVPTRGAVRLEWEIASDDVVVGFQLLRYNERTKRSDLLPRGTVLMPDVRAFVDDAVELSQEYAYTLVVLLENADDVVSETLHVRTMSERNELSQNHPNPFNPTTRIDYSIAEPGPVTLEIFDAAGRLVRTMLNSNREAGASFSIWDGRDDRGVPVASGVYMYRLRAGKFSDSKKMILLK